MKIRNIIMIIIVMFSINISSIYAIDTDYNNTESNVIASEIDEDSDSLQPVDPSGYEVNDLKLEGGGTYYWYEIWGIRIVILTVIIVMIIFGIKLLKKNNEVEKNDFYEE